MTEDCNAADFWAFSLRIYAGQGVSEACLALQDESGADVNIVLFILWRARSGIALGAGEIERLDEHVSVWRCSVVQPLRKVRRQLKVSVVPLRRSEAHAYREKVKALELEGERLQQIAMADIAAKLDGQAGTSPLDAARDGLMAYGTLLGVALSARHVSTLLDALSSIQAQKT